LYEDRRKFCRADPWVALLETGRPTGSPLQSQTRRDYRPRLPAKAQKNAIESAIIIKSATLEIERCDIFMISSTEKTAGYNRHAEPVRAPIDPRPRGRRERLLKNKVAFGEPNLHRHAKQGVGFIPICVTQDLRRLSGQPAVL
jgi:hypothetical protein